MEKSKREIAKQQIELQEEIQKAGYNIVTCGNCGSVLLHRIGKETIDCFCGKQTLSNCSDLWYRGVENNEEFKD